MRDEVARVLRPDRPVPLFYEESFDKTGAAIGREEPSRRSDSKFARVREISLRFRLLESLYTCRALAISRQLPAVVVWPSVHKRCI